MLSVHGQSADAVWRQALARLSQTAPVQESRDQQTRELLHATFTIDDPRQRVVFSRPINPAFAIAEVIWILAGANDADFLLFWNPRMAQFVDTGADHFHGAYGYRLGSQPNLTGHVAGRLRRNLKVDQLRNAFRALKATPYSRQVVLQIWDHTQDLPDPLPRSKDIPCNLMSHLLLRNGKLEWLQVMRSNDLVWGTPYNFIQFTTLQEIMAGWLGVDLGSYNHVSDSLHVYERHWELLAPSSQLPAGKLPTNNADLRLPYEEWEVIWGKLIEIAATLSRAKKAGELQHTCDSSRTMPEAYRQWVALLTAEALRRRAFDREAREMIRSAGSFWSRSWLTWADSLAR